MSKNEIQSWTEKYQSKITEKWGMKSDIWGCYEESIITKDNIYFKTKVTIINHGYLEVEL